MSRGISWATKDKVQQANYFGSLTQASTIRVGSFNGEEIYAPFKSLLPMVKANSFFNLVFCSRTRKCYVIRKLLYFFSFAEYIRLIQMT